MRGLAGGARLQQGKGYRVGKLHHVPFVFSSNGRQFVEYDIESGRTSEARLLSEFPRPDELVERYLANRGISRTPPAFTLLTTPYAQGRDFLRYYQDAAIRAAIEQIVRQTDAGQRPRVLLPLATGAGKTRLAARASV